MTQTNIAIIGAGPHGIAAAAHLRRASIECHVIGQPMSFWQTMPVGMLLRSNRTATSIAEYDGPLSLESYYARLGQPLELPLPLERFIEYGLWVQRQVAPDVDRRAVRSVTHDGDRFRLTMDDGKELSARRVVVAAGIGDFVHRPDVTRGLPPNVASHTGDHRDFSTFRGSRVLVVGGGQSALEAAALLHESAAEVEVVVRRDHINWLHGGKYHRKLGRYARLVYAPTDVGPMGLSRIVAVPNAFRRLPRGLQDPIAYRSIRPAGAAWLRPRLADVPIHLACSVRRASPQGSHLRVELDDGTTRDVHHLMFGTGYRVDVARYPFLGASLVDGIERVHGYPLLHSGMESSVPGLHFLGAPAAWSFGPVMRFVAGGWFGAQTLTHRLSGGTPSPGRRRRLSGVAVSEGQAP
jgi:Pyridine nucleotide-disulphide oxidoreductase